MMINRKENMMSSERFMELVRENDGFEIVHAYQDFEDHVLGGKGNTFWYTILKKDKVKESFLGVFEDGVWKDTHIKGSGARQKTEDLEPGETIQRIAEMAYWKQEEKWVKDRKGTLVEDSHPHKHYVFGFGDRALDVSEQYGVTIGFSDIKDTTASFRLRYLWTGEEVKQP